MTHLPLEAAFQRYINIGPLLLRMLQHEEALHQHEQHVPDELNLSATFSSAALTRDGRRPHARLFTTTQPHSPKHYAKRIHPHHLRPCPLPLMC